MTAKSPVRLINSCTVRVERKIKGQTEKESWGYKGVTGVGCCSSGVEVSCLPRLEEREVVVVVLQGQHLTK